MCIGIAIVVGTIAGERLVTHPQDIGWHALAHLTMLHGAIPNNILDRSQYAFLATAWSVSLEWQFYLVAPLIVALCRTSRGAAVIAAGAIACAFLYWRIGWHWISLSFLVGAFP